jgi:hypothetical protein
MKYYINEKDADKINELIKKRKLVSAIKILHHEYSINLLFAKNIINSTENIKNHPDIAIIKKKKMFGFVLIQKVEHNNDIFFVSELSWSIKPNMAKIFNTKEEIKIIINEKFSKYGGLYIGKLEYSLTKIGEKINE